MMVLDLMLPGEDGLTICRRLRQQENEIPIVMLTAKGDEVDRIIGLELGADDYLPKPFNPARAAGPYQSGIAPQIRRCARAHRPQKSPLLPSLPIPSIWRPVR